MPEMFENDSSQLAHHIGFALRKGSQGEPDTPVAVMAQGKERFFADEQFLAGMSVNTYNNQPQANLYRAALGGLHEKIISRDNLGPPLGSVEDFKVQEQSAIQTIPKLAINHGFGMN